MPQTSWYQKRSGHADHIVYLDKKAKELQKLISQEKTMIIRGAAGKKVPLGGRVKEGDMLYFVETGSNLMITHRAMVKQVIETDKMTEDESVRFVAFYQDKLKLASHQIERWAGKKFLCLVEVHPLEVLEPFYYHREKNMDDWIILDDVRSVIK